MSGQAKVRAPAKINLALRVLRRRPDGYHDIDTLFQAIDLCDDVEVELSGAGVSLEVEGRSDLGPADQNQALCGNKIDAIIFEAGHPNGLTQEATTGCQARLAARCAVTYDESPLRRHS